MESFNKKIVIGAFSGMIAALFSILISDLHTIADIFIFTSKGNYHYMQYPMYITGFIAGPIVVVALCFFGTGFFYCWKKEHNKIPKLISLVIFTYAFSQLLLCLADIHYANTIATYSNTTTLDPLILAGTIRGFAALFVGVTGGLGLIPIFMIFFRKKNKIAYVGALIAFISVILGLCAKILALYYFPIILMYLFIVLMIIKALGFILVCKGLYDCSK